MNLNGMGRGCVGWSHLAQDVLQDKAIIVHFLQTCGNFIMGTLQLSLITRESNVYWTVHHCNS